MNPTHLKIGFLGALMAMWLKYIYHYCRILGVYANANYHVLHTDLYITVEWWLLFSMALFTVTGILLVETLISPRS